MISGFAGFRLFLHSIDTGPDEVCSTIAITGEVELNQAGAAASRALRVSDAIRSGIMWANTYA